MINPMLPDRRIFDSDPAGYSSSAWMRWAMLQAVLGQKIDPTQSPSSRDLKDPILWLAQAEAMSQAAYVLIRNEPKFDNMPIPIRGICDTQYCAVALMLVGYSLEICLKAMILLKDGIDAYTEGKHNHHKLHELATFLPFLSAKDKAILRLLTHFVYWAGRYPDPGKRISDYEDVFELSEKNEVSARDLFGLAAKVMAHVRTLVGSKPS